MSFLESAFDEIRKKGIPAFKNYAPATIIYFLLSFYLLHDEASYLHILTGIVVINYYIYFTHRICHSLPSDGIFKYLNPHLGFHHQHNNSYWALFPETLVNISWFSGIFIAQYLSDIWIVPLNMLLMFMMMYVSGHIINYSIIGSETHRKQHADLTVNFSPDYMDHLFGSNADSTFENYNHGIPNIVISFFIIYYLKYGSLRPLITVKG